MTKHRSKHSGRPPDLAETKAHIFIAGHELLKAAEGMLTFCKSYVENTGKNHKHDHVVKLLGKGINIAKDLGSSMAGEAIIKNTTTKIFKGFCDTLENEMRQEKTCQKRTTTKTAKKKKSKKIKRKA